MAAIGFDYEEAGIGGINFNISKTAKQKPARRPADRGFNCDELERIRDANPSLLHAPFSEVDAYIRSRGGIPDSAGMIIPAPPQRQSKPSTLTVNDYLNVFSTTKANTIKSREELIKLKKETVEELRNCRDSRSRVSVVNFYLSQLDSSFWPQGFHIRKLQSGLELPAVADVVHPIQGSYNQLELAACVCVLSDTIPTVLGLKNAFETLISKVAPQGGIQDYYVVNKYVFFLPPHPSQIMEIFRLILKTPKSSNRIKWLKFIQQYNIQKELKVKSKKKNTRKAVIADDGLEDLSYTTFGLSFSGFSAPVAVSEDGMSPIEKRHAEILKKARVSGKRVVGGAAQAVTATVRTSGGPTGSVKFTDESFYNKMDDLSEALDLSVDCASDEQLKGVSDWEK